MVQRTSTFKEVVGKAKVSSKTRSEKCSKTGNVKRISVYENVLASNSFSNIKQVRVKKTPAEKYREHHLSRFNRFMEVAKRAEQNGLMKGMRYHTTLTISDEHLKLARVPTKLSKQIKTMLKQHGVAGIGVLEKCDNEAGKLHAHVLSNRRISQDWWEFGFVKTKKIKSKGVRVKKYLKKSFYKSEEKAAYFSPKEQKVVTMTDRDFFSGLWGNGKEHKLIVSADLKKMERFLMLEDKSTNNTKKAVENRVIQAGQQMDSYSTYSNTFLIRSSIFLSCYSKILKELEDMIDSGSDDDALVHMVNIPFDDFAKRIRVTHRGTCGYHLELDMSGKKPIEDSWTLHKYMMMDSSIHWLTSANKDLIRESFRKLRNTVNAKLIDDGK